MSMKKKKMTSVSFSTAPNEVGDREENVRISITPPRSNILLVAPSRNDSYSSQGQPSTNFCPLLFERASKTWWHPKFDSAILEAQYRRSIYTHIRKRFQYALIYLCVLFISFSIYFSVLATPNWIIFVSVIAVFFIATAALLAFSYTNLYQVYYWHISIGTVMCLYLFSLLAFLPYSEDKAYGMDICSISMFSIAMEIILLVYTVIPLPLHFCIVFSGLYSVAFEVLSAVLIVEASSAILIVMRTLLHLFIHMLGIHILLMSEVQMRTTFLKVGQSLMVRKDLEVEKHLKEKIIHCMMPPKVADWLMSLQEAEEEAVQGGSPDSDRKTSATTQQSQMIFRPFNMHCMENVSILFADIVGFTKMSSNKTAEQLVGLLNDLFGRFDYLCNKLGCEKISTLGDCYYCVSGCPEPRPDHARCCVEMGLGMIRVIGEFDEDTCEDVNMRVGVHTGTVLCGIVGTSRFKFDVLSNDVTFANFMESTGKPGRVHISDATYSFLVDYYYVEEGLPQKGQKTYFIKGLKPAAMERMMSITSTRHSWSYQPRGSVDVGLKKTMEQEAEDVEPAAHVPMLPVHRHSSLSTLTSCSRKDSGIQSRGSSLHDAIIDSSAILTSNLLSHRLTHSQVSLADTGRGSSGGSSARGYSIYVDPTLSLNESLVRIRHLKKQSDLQLIRCLQQDSAHADYFVRPPINHFSLFFSDSSLETKYRKALNQKDALPTFASAMFNTYFDIIISFILYVIISIYCIILFPYRFSWLILFLLATFGHTFALILCTHNILVTRDSCHSIKLQTLYQFLMRWYPWHLYITFLIVLPSASFLVNFHCDSLFQNPEQFYGLSYLLVISLLHFANFTQINYWLRAILACGIGVSFGLIIYFCPCNTTTDLCFVTQNLVYEIILDTVLILILVWFLSREFEISHRLSFHGGVTALRDKKKIQAMKNQADWLLHNILPKHVAEQLKSTSKYSENHKNAGIIFASIVNFNEMYDESYEGGKEYLRVLNELVGDFDELLLKPEFKNVEKIKTIGSTYMVASGLNPQLRKENPHSSTHLYELMQFGFTMQKVIEHFNYNLLEFSFIIRIGYNFGDVTAGVIGNTKLYYDIWGDAVNIASRMDSTGVPSHIQVPEHCLEILKEWFDFEYRGSIYVKGKDNMNVYLVSQRADSIYPATTTLLEKIEDEVLEEDEEE